MAAKGVRNFVRITTNRDGVLRSFIHPNIYSIVAQRDNVLRLDGHYLNANDTIAGHHGAAYPKSDVRAIDFLSEVPNA